MAIDPNRIADTLEQLGEDYADKNGAANLLEEMKSTLFAKLAREHINAGSAIGKAEIMAKADPTYEGHIKAMCSARTEADKAKARLESFRARIDVWRTRSATERAAMTLR